MSTILLVEGGEHTTHTLGATLQSVSRHVVGGPTAALALTALASRRPTAAFVRLVGEAPPIAKTCQQLKADPRLRGVPVSVCAEGAVLAEQAFIGGADDFFRNPRSTDELRARIAAAKAPPTPVMERQKTILIVDDDLFFRKSIAELLQTEGYRTLEAASGVEALAVMEKTTPALAVVDLFLPNLGGIELVQMMRASPRWQQLPVVAISGIRAAHEKGLGGRLKDLGIYDFIEKRGLALETLAAVVDEALEDDPDRHRAPRVSAKLMGEFRLEGGLPWLSGLVTNVGTGGAFIRTLVIAPVHQQLYFRMEWGDERQPLMCRARVVWTRPRSVHGGVTGMGVAFGELSSQDQESLRSLVYI